MEVLSGTRTESPRCRITWENAARFVGEGVTLIHRLAFCTGDLLYESQLLDGYIHLCRWRLDVNAARRVEGIYSPLSSHVALALQVENTNIIDHKI